ncbi:MAG: DUF1501 domain-containing protein [Gemmataceae bacterium]
MGRSATLLRRPVAAYSQDRAFGRTTLADVLRAKANANPAQSGGQAMPPKAAIMIYLPGGPSHMDMYDLKPEAPMEYRGEFKPTNTNVPGIQICEHMPRQARMMDKLAIIRSLVSVDEHSDSLVMSAYKENTNRIQHHPSFGSVVSRLRGNAGGDIPPFVSLRGQSIGSEPGWCCSSRLHAGWAGPQQSRDGERRANQDRTGDRRELKLNHPMRCDATSIRRERCEAWIRSPNAFDMVASVPLAGHWI